MTRKIQLPVFKKVGKLSRSIIKKVQTQPTALIRSPDAILFFSAIPLLVLMAIDSRFFVAGWNEGKGGLLFAVLFLGMEWYDAKGSLRAGISRRRASILVLSIITISGYYFAMYGVGGSAYLVDVGKRYLPEIPGMFSWLAMWDFLAFALYLVLILAVRFSLSSVRMFPTPLVYLGGMITLFYIDASFPHGSLGFLQDWVQVVLNTSLFFIRMAGIEVLPTPFMEIRPPAVYLSQNRLAVWGNHGFVQLVVFWPSSGIVSMLVFSMVIAVLMIKLAAPLRRKLVYMVCGGAGTFVTNAIRISLITYYVAFVGTDVRVFHDFIGEILFMIWVIIFLVIVVKVEDLLPRRHGKRQTSRKPGGRLLGLPLKSVPRK